MFDFQTLQDLSKGAAKIDVACPACGPGCKTPVNRTRKVLRIYNAEPGFTTYVCARCGEKGFAHEKNHRSRNTAADQSRFFKPIGTSRRVPEPDAEDIKAKKKKAETARYLWQRRKPIAGTIAETYLREARGYSGPLPATLGFLPASRDYEPSMIAAFGVAAEPEPGILRIHSDAVTGIHLTKLLPDGSGKADVERPKIMLGSSIGQPIVVAPCNDLLGLVIAEGIEDGLTAHAITGRGAWAAGSASRLPKLADVVPSYIESVTVLVDDDDAGNNNAKQLITKLYDRGFEVRVEAGGTP